MLNFLQVTTQELLKFPNILYFWRLFFQIGCFQFIFLQLIKGKEPQFLIMNRFIIIISCLQNIAGHNWLAIALCKLPFDWNSYFLHFVSMARKARFGPLKKKIIIIIELQTLKGRSSIYQPSLVIYLTVNIRDCQKELGRINVLKFNW